MAVTVRNAPQCGEVRGDIAAQLDQRGYAHIGPLLDDKTVDSLIRMYGKETPFRNQIIMQRHNFGKGEYKYFDYPLPHRVAELRESLYGELAPIANAWQKRLGSERRYPQSLAGMLGSCHAAGQTRPTPLMLKYSAGDYNCLHQDLYGEHVFPLQLVVLLSDEDAFEGGEFVLTEQRPRMQSRVEVVPLQKGHGVVFAVNERPKLGTRGYYRVKMRHGVSELRSGERYALGVIFHDAA